MRACTEIEMRRRRAVCSRVYRSEVRAVAAAKSTLLARRINFPSHVKVLKRNSGDRRRGYTSHNADSPAAKESHKIRVCVCT